MKYNFLFLKAMKREKSQSTWDANCWPAWRTGNGIYGLLGSLELCESINPSNRRLSDTPSDFCLYFPEFKNKKLETTGRWLIWGPSLQEKEGLFSPCKYPLTILWTSPTSVSEPTLEYKSGRQYRAVSFLTWMETQWCHQANCAQ